jgi:hypothetical protein
MYKERKSHNNLVYVYKIETLFLSALNIAHSETVLNKIAQEGGRKMKNEDQMEKMLKDATVTQRLQVVQKR